MDADLSGAVGALMIVIPDGGGADAEEVVENFHW
jgi:hypothetical protein